MKLSLRIPGLRMPDLKIDWNTLGQRLLYGAVVGTIQNVATGSDTSARGLLTSAGVGLLSAVPVAAQAAGIWRPATPGQVSLAQGIANAAVGVITAPASARNQAIRQAVADAKPAIIQEVLAGLTSHGDLTAEELADGHAAMDAGKAPTAATEGKME